MQMDTWSSMALISCLPDDMMLEIFKHLDCYDLGRISSVCQDWRRLSSDQLLWYKKFMDEVRRRACISHGLLRDLKEEFSREDVLIDWKLTYLKHRQRKEKAVHPVVTMYNSVMRYLTTAKQLAMLGPGLEGAHHTFLTRILHSDSSPFRVLRMFPGKVAGLGSGFSMCLPDGRQFDLITLYTRFRKERQQKSGHNRLFTSNSQEELNPQLQVLASEVNGWLFVVDEDSLTEPASEEMRAVLKAGQSTTPLVVLVLCDPDASNTALDVTDKLQLKRLSQPWSVMIVNPHDLRSILPAFRWLLESKDVA